jgi:hypothetical protein
VSRATLADGTSRHESMVREMSTPYKNQLSEEEREELNAISAKVQSLRVAVVEQSTLFFCCLVFVVWFVF